VCLLAGWGCLALAAWRSAANAPRHHPAETSPDTRAVPQPEEEQPAAPTARRG
jgi:hypothetical protein